MTYITNKATIRQEDFSDDERNTIDEIIIAKKTKSLHKHAFSGFVNLRKVTILAPLKRCESYVFYNCKNLKEVILPEGLAAIPAEFLMNTGIESIQIPQSVETIQFNAFSHCSELTEVVIPDGVKSLETDVFEGDSKLEKVYLPPNMTHISPSAFNLCSKKLQLIVEKGSATEKLLRASKELEKVYDRRSVLKQEILENMRKVSVQVCFENLCSELNLQLQIRDKNTNRFLRNRWFDIYIRDNLVISLEDVLEQTETMQENISQFFSELKSFSKQNAGFENLDVEALYNFGLRHFDLVSWEVYSQNKKVAVHFAELYYIPSRDDKIRYLSFGKQVQRINPENFMDTPELQKVIFYQGIQKIGARAFSGCFELEDIRFLGTIEQWSMVQKKRDWAADINTHVVKCLDGEVPIE